MDGVFGTRSRSPATATRPTAQASCALPLTDAGHTAIIKHAVAGRQLEGRGPYAHSATLSAYDRTDITWFLGCRTTALGSLIDVMIFAWTGRQPAPPRSNDAPQPVFSDVRCGKFGAQHAEGAR